jgi:hypothetical protein
MGALSHLTIQRIMDTGHIMVFADPVVISSKKLEEPSTLLTYFDFICKIYTITLLGVLSSYNDIFAGFLLSEVDKSTPVAIEYW